MKAENGPSLEERTFGFYLAGNLPIDTDPYKIIRQLSLLENAADRDIWSAFKDNKIPYNDQSVRDVRARNIFLNCNSGFFLERLLARIGKYWMPRGFTDSILNRYGLGSSSSQETMYAIAHDMGDGRQSEFAFCYEVSKRKSPEEADVVADAVNQYTKAYENFWRKGLEGRANLTEPLKDQKRVQLYDYQHCLTPEYQQRRPNPFISADYQIMDMLAKVEKPAFDQYVKKYGSSK